MSDNLQVLADWMVDAEKDGNIDHFVSFKMLERIEDGRRCFIVGRKGTGKTIIGRYISSKYKAEKIPIDTHVFKMLMNDLERNNNINISRDFIEIWKYYIYIHMCKIYYEHNIFNFDDRVLFEKVLYGGDSVSIGSESKGFAGNFKLGFSLFGADFSAEGEVKKIDVENEIRKVNSRIERIISSYNYKENVFVIFDGGLDEDMCAGHDGISRFREYIVALIRAIEDIKSKKNINNILPIACIREDLFYTLRSNDRSKWIDYRYSPEWNVEKIQKILLKKMQLAANSNETDFNILWSHFFTAGTISVGKSRKSIFDYIGYYSQNRPRDYIAYIRMAAELAIEKGEDLIDPSIIRGTLPIYSQYGRNEADAEISMIHRNHDDIFSALRDIRKPIFAFEEFEEQYDARKKPGDADARTVIADLYRYSVVGNISATAHPRYRYEVLSDYVDYERKFSIHVSLFKSLNIL